jgi:hypothetical protein
VRVRRTGKFFSGRRKKPSALAGVLDPIVQPGRVATPSNPLTSAA